MITLKEWMEIVDYRITEGDTYWWNCYGSDAYQLGAWNGIHGTGGWSANIIFDTKTQVVYEVEVCDYTGNRAYRLINPDYKKAHDAEAGSRDVLANQAWDDVDYTDLEVDDDWIQKALAIKEGKSYDTRVSISIELEDSEMLKLMTLAHERDITLNKLIEEILWNQINKHNKS